MLLRLEGGTLLRNLGCQDYSDRRWCQVATLSEPQVQAWAVASNLDPAPAPPGSNQRVAPAEEVSAAERACLDAVALQARTNKVEVLALDDSGPDVLVQVGAGAELEPWQCLANPGGVVRGVEPLGPDVAPPEQSAGSAAAEAACIAAVAQAAGIGAVLVLSSSSSTDGAKVHLAVGTDGRPWVCRARPDGTVTGIEQDGEG